MSRKKKIEKQYLLAFVEYGGGLEFRYGDDDVLSEEGVMLSIQDYVLDTASSDHERIVVAEVVDNIGGVSIADIVEKMYNELDSDSEVLNEAEEYAEYLRLHKKYANKTNKGGRR